MNLDTLKDIPYNKRTSCPVCQNQYAKPVIGLPSLPLTELYLQEPTDENIGKTDQNLLFCNKCGHAFLSNILDQEILYGNTYSFRTSKSMSVKGNDVFLEFINKVTQKRNFHAIFEIGCNDLYLLHSLEDRANTLLGIDPTLKGREKELSTDKIRVIGDFIENIDPKEYNHFGDTMIISSQVLEHIVNPKEMMKHLLYNSDAGTIFVFQFPGFDDLVKNYRFDQIFHHHLNYFSLSSFSYLSNELGCELLDYEVNHHYWGSLMVAFKKISKISPNPMITKLSVEKIQKNYNIFKNTMLNTNEYLDSFKGENIYGYGAGLQIPVLCYHLDNDFSSFKCIIDDDENKDGLYYPNLNVPIKHVSKINSFNEAIIVITGINFTRSIVPKVVLLNPKQIVLPMNII